MTKSISIQAEFHCHGNKRKLPARWDEHLLRIAQESLNNSSRHSNARHFLADLYYDAAEVRLEWDLAPKSVASETRRWARHEVILLLSADNRSAFRVPAISRASV